MERQIALVKLDMTKSAALITRSGQALLDDPSVEITPEDMRKFVEWGQACDKRFKGRTGQRVPHTRL